MAKRRLIIRELELDRWGKNRKAQYKSIVFTPLTRDYFAKRHTYYMLKDKQYLADQYLLYEYPHAMLRRLTSFKLNDNRYPQWLLKYDDNGQLLIRAGMRQPESRLGFVTLVEIDK